MFPGVCMSIIQVMQSSVKNGVGKSGKPYKALIVKGAIVDEASGEMRMVDDMCFLHDDKIRPLKPGKYQIVSECRVLDGRIVPRVVDFVLVNAG